MDIELYRRLFVHRSDVFARQNEDGSYAPVRRPLTDADLLAHLSGERSYGVYVIAPRPSGYSSQGGQMQSWEYPPNSVSSIVFDLDTYDKAALAFLTEQVELLVAPAAFQWFGPTAGGRQNGCLLLEDSGGKGYHIWLFLSAPLAAARARSWTQKIAESYRDNARVGVRGVANAMSGDPWPALEIFPKQDTVPEGGFGNLVKLPFGIHAKSRAVSFPIPRDGWADTLEDVTPYPVELVPAATTKAKPAGRPEPSGLTRFACVDRILDEGAGEGQRDLALLHLAHYARGVGLPRDLAEDWCVQVNGEWDSPLPDNQVRTKVASAFRMEAPHPSCGQDWLRDFCPGSDRMRSCPNYRGDVNREISDGLDWS